MILTIKGKEYTLKTSLRAIVIFEKIMKKTFSLDLATDKCVFFYSIILASNKDVDMTFEQFIDAIDEDPNLLYRFAEFLESESAEFFPISDKK